MIPTANMATSTYQQKSDLMEVDPFWPPLMSAAEAGDLSMCKQLVSEGADINCFVMESEASVVTVALENGHENVFFWLLDHGAQLEHEQYCCDVCGMTYEITKESLLESAITGGCVNAIEALVARGADWDRRDQYGETPREFAKRICFHMRQQDERSAAERMGV